MTTIEISTPAAATEAWLVTKNGKFMSEGRGQPAHILVVDEDHVMRHMLVNYLDYRLRRGQAILACLKRPRRAGRETQRGWLPGMARGLSVH